VHAVPINDAAFAKAAVVAINMPLAKPFQSQPTLTYSPTTDQTWCPCCGRPQADPMTGLMDRWMWAQRAATLLDRFGSEHDPITLLMADLDRFKLINDSAGHIAGDAVLAAVADVIRSETRSGDLWGRYGSYAGDEFVGLLPGASLPAAVSVAERLQDRIAVMGIPVATPTGTTEEINDLSISIGLATHTPGRSLEDTVGRADMALLEAKRSGRDCVCVVDARSHVIVTHRGDHDRNNERSYREQAC
jgi:diguanylate cyclase (GGDEF)-like protein